MQKELIISTTPQETKLAILEDEPQPIRLGLRPSCHEPSEHRDAEGIVHLSRPGKRGRSRRPRYRM